MNWIGLWVLALVACVVVGLVGLVGTGDARFLFMLLPLVVLRAGLKLR